MTKPFSVAGSVLSAYEQALGRVDKARAALTVPLIGTETIRAMSAAGAVANAIRNMGARVPPKPVPHMDRLLVPPSPIQESPAKPVPGLVALTNEKAFPVTHYSRIELLCQQVQALSLSWANLWSVDITEARAGGSPGDSRAAERLELLAENVSFGTRTLTGETVPVGSAAIDRRGVAQGTGVRITTRDDADGTLQQWFEAKCDQVAKADGTFGYPKDYLLLIRVTRLKRNPANPGGELLRGLQREFLVLAASCEEEYSRSEAQLQTVSLSFEPWNTFGPTNLVAK